MSIAICIPTYGCAKAVEQVLNSSLNLYKKYDIDVYYFDSSEDNETEKIVEKYISLGFDNLFYCKLQTGCLLDYKIDLILEGKYLRKKYDYVWPMKNRAYVDEATLIEVIKSTKEKDDVIVIGATRCEGLTSIIYTDPVEFYGRWGWLVTSLDIVIYRYDTMLKEYNAKAFHDLHKRKHFSNWIIWFFLFWQLAQIEKPRIKFLYGDNIKKFDVTMGQSLWTKDILKIWVTCWIDVNESLPDCYNIYREQVIKAATSMTYILGGEKRLIELYDKGAFTLDEFEKIEKNWERVSDVPRKIARKIASGDKVEEDILYSEKREIISVLLSLHNLIYENKITSSEIPINDIMNYLIDSYENKSYCTEEKIDLLNKSLDYIKNKILNDEIEQAEKCDMIVILLNYFLLLN